MSDGFQGLKERPTFAVPGEAPVRVELQHLDSDPLDPANPVVLLIGTVDLQPPEKAAQALRQLAAGEIPDGSALNDERRRFWGEADSAPQFDELPGSLREFSHKVSRLLSSAVTRSYEIIRWRFDVDGPPQPYSSRGIKWSDDLDTWHRLPSDISARLGTLRLTTPLPVERVLAVEVLLDAGADEPLGHHMLREARATAGRHHASALVMGIAAAEIGTKQLIAALVPDATWLAENLPSPPLVRMLSEYLPLLPLLNRDPRLVPPPWSIPRASEEGSDEAQLRRARRGPNGRRRPSRQCPRRGRGPPVALGLLRGPRVGTRPPELRAAG